MQNQKRRIAIKSLRASSRIFIMMQDIKCTKSAWAYGFFCKRRMLIELNPKIVERLSKTELSIIRFINENEKKIPEMSIVEIGYQTFTSPATVSRAIRKCNMAGFNELRHRCTLTNQEATIHKMGDIINQSLLEIQEVTETVTIPKILEFIQGIKESEKIYIFARGLTEFVAEEFSLKLQLIGHTTIFIRDPNIMRNISRKMRKNNLLLIFSLNGKTPELIESAQNARCAGAKIAVCCCNKKSELLPLADYLLLGYSDKYTMIEDYEVRSRLPLYVLSRIITEYLATKE